MRGTAAGYRRYPRYPGMCDTVHHPWNVIAVQSLPGILQNLIKDKFVMIEKITDKTISDKLEETIKLSTRKLLRRMTHTPIR